MSREKLLEWFPRLSESTFAVTSPPDRFYNCIAWAAGDTLHWWWPDEGKCGYWPKGAPREETIDAFVAAFRGYGFEACDSAEIEAGYEKVAVFVDSDGVPTHAARQLSGGSWTSKIGKAEDIEHGDLLSLEGDAPPAYGRVALILKKRIVDLGE